MESNEIDSEFSIPEINMSKIGDVEGGDGGTREQDLLLEKLENKMLGETELTRQDLDYIYLLYFNQLKKASSYSQFAELQKDQKIECIQRLSCSISTSHQRFKFLSYGIGILPKAAEAEQTRNPQNLNQQPQQTATEAEAVETTATAMDNSTTSPAVVQENERRPALFENTIAETNSSASASASASSHINSNINSNSTTTAAAAATTTTTTTAAAAVSAASIATSANPSVNAIVTVAKSQANPSPNPKITKAQNILCGILSGGIARIIVSPIDVRIVRLRLSSVIPVQTPLLGVIFDFLSAPLRFIRNSGPDFNFTVISVLRTIPLNACKIISNALIRKLWPGAKNSDFSSLVRSILVSLSGVLVTYPLEVLAVRSLVPRQADQKHVRHSPTHFQSVKRQQKL